MEHGATRNFQAEKLLEEEEKRVQKERQDEELNNPMKVQGPPPARLAEPRCSPSLPCPAAGLWKIPGPHS